MTPTTPAHPPHRIRLREVRERTGPTLGPQSIGIVLTNACNLNCVTCWTYSPLRTERPAIAWMRRRLTRETLLPLFADAAALQTERVIFTGGGDPLAHPDFERIAADAKAQGLKVTLISNLTLVRDPDVFLALGIDTLLANFSCGDAESYVAFHPNRTRDDFPRLLGLLQQVATAGTQVKLVFVVCAVNANALSPAIEIAATLNAEIQFKLMSVTDDTKSLALSEEQRRDIQAHWPTLQGQATVGNVIVNWDAFGAELSGSSVTAFPIEATGCYAGHYYGRITAEGDVYFCCNRHPTLRVGSLADATFRELWYSERWAQMRSRLQSGRFVPGCQQCGKFDLNRKIARQLDIINT